MKNLRSVLFVSLLAIVFTAIGCAPKAPYGIVEIAGVATFDGKPLPKDCKIDFIPDDGKRPSSAIIRADDGKFVAVHTVNQDGVPVGKCKVTVSWAGDIGTSPPAEFGPLFQKFGFGKEGMSVEISKADKNFKLDFTVAGE